MALIPAKCPNCGAVLSVDSNGKAEVCEHCGSAFIVEEAINNFNTTYNITNNTVNNIHANNVVLEQLDQKYMDTLQKLKASANEAKSIDRLYRIYTSPSDAMRLYFDKPDIWYYSALKLYLNTTRSVLDYNDATWKEWFEKAIEITPDAEKKETLRSELAWLTEEQSKIDQNRGKYREQLKKHLSHDTASFDGLRIYEKTYGGRTEDQLWHEKGIFSFFENTLYFLRMDGPYRCTPIKVSNGDGFLDECKFIPGAKIKHMSFVGDMNFVYSYETIKGETYFKEAIITAKKNDAANHTYLQLFQPYNANDKAFYQWEINDLNEKKVFRELLLMSQKRCFICGYPVSFSSISMKYKCSTGCTLKPIFDPQTPFRIMFKVRSRG